MIKPALVYKGGLKHKMKKFPDEMKRILTEVITAWHSDTLLGHFTRDGASKYKYTPRGSKYQKRKVRMTGQGDPLVYSGTTKTQVTRSIRISGTAKRMRGTMTGSNRALNFSGRAGMPNMREELVAYTAAEERAMARMVEQKTKEFFTKQDSTETVKG